MNSELLNIFLSEDGDTRARQRLLDAIRKQRISGAPLVQKFYFNRFNLTLDFELKQVFLQDDLTVGAQGEFKLDLEDFERTLVLSKGGKLCDSGSSFGIAETTNKITVKTFERAVAQYFEPIARDHNWSLIRRGLGVYEILTSHFAMRVRFDVGAHNKSIVATLIPMEEMPGDIEKGGRGELGVLVIAGYNGIDIQYIPWESNERGFFEQAQYMADMTTNYGVPYLLGQKADWDQVKNYIQEKIDEDLAKIRNYKFPPRFQKRWHLPPPPNPEKGQK